MFALRVRLVPMRVISGRFKGMALATPKAGTRPTTDRTKEAVFSRLDAWDVLEDARVLDLFAGTGALGIEALSRGARELVAVESARPAAALIERTLAALRRNRAWASELAARVVTRRAEQFVAAQATLEPVDGQAFDVVFIDPPYDLATEDCDQLLADLAAGHLVHEESLIVLERSARSADPKPPAGWEISERRDYGETAVFYIEAVRDEPASETIEE